MQNTSNYNLNLVEGTDLVNPPIQFNPNFQTIDAAMFANKEKTIGTASEVVTGTVHAIVRANQNADAFRFTATGAWTTGDTMTVDGTAVTVHLSDGTAPLTGAYIIGAEVLAILNGTLVTLITSNAAIDPGVTSFNSRTGAVSPTTSDYDASMIDYDNTLSGLTSTDVQAAIDEIVAGVGPSGSVFRVAWTTPDITGTFAAQVVNLTTDGDYDAVLILFDVGNNTTGQGVIIKKGLDGNIFSILPSLTPGSSQIVGRGVTVAADGMTVTFADAIRTYIQNDTASVNNGFAKPRQIITIKY